jgi:hypothetical protein
MCSPLRGGGIENLDHSAHQFIQSLQALDRPLTKPRLAQ